MTSERLLNVLRYTTISITVLYLPKNMTLPKQISAKILHPFPVMLRPQGQGLS